MRGAGGNSFLSRSALRDPPPPHPVQAIREKLDAAFARGWAQVESLLSVSPFLVSLLPDSLVGPPRGGAATMTPADAASESGARAFAWHPYQQMFAVATSESSVVVYSLTSESWLPIQLQHDFMQGVQALAWRPLSGRVLAVGCASGVGVWSLTHSRKSSSTRESLSAFVRFFEVPACPGPTRALSWSPDGSLLACGAGSLCVWEYATGAPTVLRRAGSGVVAVAWSPSGNQLATASEGAKGFLLWETRSWTYERWSGFSGPASILAWGPGGAHLIAASPMESVFHVFKVDSSPGSYSALHVRAESLDSYLATYPSGDTVTVGGRIRDLAWDITGERLAVTTQGPDEEADSLVALYALRLSPFVDLTPRGFVRGPADARTAYHISFRNSNPTTGALLSVVYDTGKLGLFPLLFQRPSSN